MVVCGYLADALWPSLVSSKPLLLIGLSAKNRYLVLVVNHVDLVAYYVIGTLRLLAPDPFFFVIGWLYGAAALHWMERRTPTVGSLMRTLERWFDRFGAPLVVLFPNNYICLIAGVARMSPALFVTLDVIGTLGRLLMLQVLGDIFAGPLQSFLSFVTHWRIPILVLTIGIVAITALAEFRRGDREAEALQELEEAADEVALGHPVDHSFDQLIGRSDEVRESAPDDDAAAGPTD